MEKQKYLEEYKKYFELAETTKDKAIHSDSRDLYEVCGNYYLKTTEIFGQIKFKEQNAQYKREVLIAYYKYEADDCFYTVCIKDMEFDKAQSFAKSALINITNAIKLIDK